jgi:hypothetical protein
MAGQKREARLHADVPAVGVLLPSSFKPWDAVSSEVLRCPRQLKSLLLLFPE